MKGTTESGETYYSIHEVFYDLEEPGNKGWTDNPVEAVGESLEELRENLKRMLEATYTPVLDYETGNEV